MFLNEDDIILESNSQKAKFNSKRKRIENKVIKMFSLLDPSQKTSNFYKEFFKNMSDTKFKQFMTKLKNDDNEHLVMQVMPFENEFTYEDLRATSEYMGVPLEEYVYYKDPTTNKRYRTKHPVAVGYIHIKRLRVKRSLRSSFKDISKGLVV